MGVGPSAGVGQGKALLGRQGAYSSSCDPEGLWAGGVMRSALHFENLLARARGADWREAESPRRGRWGQRAWWQWVGGRRVW